MLRRLATFLLIISLFTAACQRKTQEAGQLKIAVIPKATSGHFWQTVHAGAEQAEKDLGVQIVWVGTEREDQRAGQITIVDAQVLNQVDGIVLAPLDGEALVKPVREAVSKKIPVVIFDSALNSDEKLITSFVATDNFVGGELAGDELAKSLNEKGNVVLLRHMEGSASTKKREAGFLKAIQKYPNIKILSSEQYGGRDPQQTAENLLLRFTQKDTPTINGIFCSNLTTTYGMLQALRRARLIGKIKLIGFDSDDSLVKALQQGEITGLIIQDPFRMGYLGVATMTKHLRGEKISSFTDTGVTFVSQKNLKNSNVQKLLYPQKKHGK